MWKDYIPSANTGSDIKDKAFQGKVGMTGIYMYLGVEHSLQ